MPPILLSWPTYQQYQQIKKDVHGAQQRREKAVVSPRGELFPSLDSESTISEPDDPLSDLRNARTNLSATAWSTTQKWSATSIVTMIAFLVGWASSIDSGAIHQAASEYKVGTVTESLATGLYCIGTGLGSLFSAPLSETYGRNMVYVSTIIVFMVCILVSTLIPHIAGQLVFRFFAGVFGSTPLTTAGGSIADMWTQRERTYVFPFYAASSFLGPFMAPLVGAYIGQSGHWHWVDWSTLMLAGVVLTLVVLFLPESYAPILVLWKAEIVKELTGDDRVYEAIEHHRVSLSQKLRIGIGRPILMLLREPIVDLFTLYLVIIYIVLFTFLTGYEYIYTDIYELSQGSTGLCYLAMNIGFLSALAFTPVIYKQYCTLLRHAQEQKGDQAGLPQEVRLWFSIYGAPCLPVSLFWMAWTTHSSISYWSSLISSVVFGFGVMCVFISSYLYLIDSFEQFAASALVGATMARYIAAGVMVVVSIPMYENLGVHWTLTLLGCLATLMAPIPFIFYEYGAYIRSKSKSASS
ncbi:benomyl/methotrexate resistance protein, partial [Aureobasidium melanogenum]